VIPAATGCSSRCWISGRLNQPKSGPGWAFRNSLELRRGCGAFREQLGRTRFTRIVCRTGREWANGIERHKNTSQSRRSGIFLRRAGELIAWVLVTGTGYTLVRVKSWMKKESERLA
jgi:hypothetical protein